MKIKSYQVISTGDKKELNDMANLLIDEGWQPLGPAQYSPTPDDGTGSEGDWYTQTMVKYA